MLSLHHRLVITLPKAKGPSQGREAYAESESRVTSRAGFEARMGNAQHPSG